MPRTQRNDNFIDKTFTVIADILYKFYQHHSVKNKHFVLSKWNVQAEVNTPKLYKIIMKLRLEVDAYDRSYILYNID
jgi:hypothetical protein